MACEAKKYANLTRYSGWMNSEGNNVRAFSDIPRELGNKPASSKHAGELLAKEATPNQERWAREHQVDREYWNKLGDAGLLGLDLPERFGGAEGDFGLSAIVAEE